MNESHACSAIEAHLPLFVGGDLEPALRGQVQGHLAACAACRQVLEALRAARGALLELSGRSPAPEVDLWPELRGALASEGLLGARPAAAARGPRLLVRALVPLAAAAGLALTLTLVQRGGPPGEPRGEPPPPAAGVAQGPEQGLAPLRVAGAAPVVPASTGGLRRLMPGDQRLGATARPFPSDGGVLQLHPSAGQRPSLAGGLR